MMNCTANFVAHLAAVLPNHLALELVDSGNDKLVTKDQGRRPGAGLYEVPYTEEERRGEKLPLG